MNQAQNIPWRRISIEAAAIVASILFAFAIDAWWDSRQEQDRLYDTLVSLEDALSTILQSVNENITESTTNKEVVQAFVQMSPEEVGQIPAPERYGTIVALFRPITLELNSSYIVEILSSSGIEVLTDPTLRTAMSRWRATVDDLNEVRFVLTDRQEVVLEALARHEEVGYAIAQDRQHKPDLSSEVMNLVRKDSQILAFASLKALRDRLHVNTLERLKRDTEHLLDLLRNAGYRQ
jgi:hypothetical protein